MTRQPHDQLAKQYLAELLAPVGKVETSRDVKSEVRQVDVWFVPASSPATEAPHLGLLGKIASGSCLLEVFRNAPTAVEVRNCQSKLFSLHSELLRQARREKQSLKEAELPYLWILSPTGSSQFLQGFGTELNQQWGEGVYFLPPSEKTAIVTINQLPVIRETLWLRILGKRSTQKAAINELVTLPSTYPGLPEILEMLANWRTNVQLSQNLTNEDQEMIMNLSPAYLRWRDDIRLEGKLEGKL
ncbi:MAG: hypothetical protein F6K31_21940, partial [Symploca sp. SIO2G7]|nr:hypothetical protein [Symploca sp. SIO2G7]